MSEAKDDKDEGEATIPGITGAMISVANSKPVAALTLPAATVVGQYFGEVAGEWVSNRKARRAKNLARFHERLEERDDGFTLDVEGPTEHQLELLLEWKEEAEKIDPDRDGDLAALWQGLLGDIYSNEESADAMLSSLRQLNKDDAITLLGSSGDYIYMPDSDAVNNLIVAKVVRRFNPKERFASPSSIILYSLLFASLLYVAPTLLQMQIRQASSQEMSNINAMYSNYAQIVSNLQPFGVLAVVISVFYTILKALKDMDRYKITKLGLKLRSSGQRFRASSPNPMT